MRKLARGRGASLRVERGARILVVLVVAGALFPLLFVLASPPARVLDPQSEQRSAREVEDRAARAAFAQLSASAKKDVVDFLTLETGRLSTFQASLVAWVSKHSDRDRGSWKLAPEPVFFDPLVHAPAQPTPRTRLDPDSRLARDAVAEMFSAIPARRLVPGFAYDYATLEVVRLGGRDELQRVFENALSGHPPDLDLCEALVERALDDHAHQAEALAFAHAYTDRSGNVYPGITLYDAYASRSEFEMPDVDVLGILHSLFPGSGTWKAPIPAAEQAPLYAKIGTAFVALHRHRSLRHALAMTYMNGSEALRDGYQTNLDNFHALWEDCSSAPNALRERLPGSAQRDEFLGAWVKRCSEPDSPFQKGLARKSTLDSDAEAVRATLLRVLREYGALPAPGTAPKDGPPPPR